MKKLYIAPDMEELRFRAMEAMAADEDASNPDYVEDLIDPSDGHPFN